LTLKVAYVYCRWAELFPLPLPRGEFDLELELEPLELEATAWTSSVFVLYISQSSWSTWMKESRR